jgi:ornithine decarboxylase
VSALAALGANFDLASPGEIDICLGLNIPPERLSFGNTIKRESAIAGASTAGVGLYAFDSAAELEKLARAAPGRHVFCRMLIENKGAEWPLLRKFGCEEHMAADLLLMPRQLGLRPAGVSFHVGSQQHDPQAWSSAIALAAWMFRACAHRGMHLDLLTSAAGCRRIIAPRYRRSANTPRRSRRPSPANSGLPCRAYSSSRAVTWSATPACCGPKFC